MLAMPEWVKVRIVPQTMGYRASDIPPPIVAPAEPVRLLIAPANYAAQGRLWARAAETLPGVGARNLVITRPGAFGFASDFTVTEHVATVSPRWARGQRRAVGSFTHALIEAERPILGGAFGGDIVREARALRAAGVSVAYVSHGSDLRLPSRHAPLEPWSPFRDEDWPLLPALESQAAANAEALRAIGAPVFIATPELLIDYPEATWLPNVVDPQRWHTDAPVLAGPTPVALHIPTSEVIKGTALIEPAMRALEAEGVVQYEQPTGIPPAEMPALLAGVDIVLEQFRLGIYSTTAIEAMAAGRIVVAHVSERVRAHVAETIGVAVPIVEATPDTVGAVLREIVADPDRYREIASRGPEFVRAAHDGRYSAGVLKDFLTTT
ncbi:hypothetical protein SAMN04487846_1217 [Microbacterium sp. cf046]|uniref:glycosyltransferase family protein n=1 Tax=Microbacterium sp. cf046 TaxID=1761803 RepID=UPI0008ED08D4|nr:glycosyltransferase family 4 protein [Microbacterium sp. cf046]SFR95692.1 hypothetical protein SAMN04487846_1217 [Microbacterium sp. cf046]